MIIVRKALGVIMINKFSDYIEGISKNMGILIKIPRPNKTAKTISMITNSLVGISLLTLGVVFRKYSFISLGLLGISGAIFAAYDK